MKHVKELVKKETICILLTTGQINTLAKRAKKGRCISFSRKGTRIIVGPKRFKIINRKAEIRAQIKALKAQLQTA